MKEGKAKLCGNEPPKQPRPNLKNKNFVKWTKAEPCKREDNIVSTDWHERLQRIAPFTPVYDNAPTNMVYLMSGEYGRMWQKERDEWFSTVFVLNKKENDMESRKRRIRKEAREAKRAAEKSIQARKEKKAAELEQKNKAEALRAEKLKKEKEEKEGMLKRKLVKKKEPQPKLVPLAQEKTETTCPKGWRQVELTVQCECSNHMKEKSEKKEKVEKGEEIEVNQGVSPPEQRIHQQPEQKPEKLEEPHMCEDYIKQLKLIQNEKVQEKSIKQETQ